MAKRFLERSTSVHGIVFIISSFSLLFLLVLNALNLFGLNEAPRQVERLLGSTRALLEIFKQLSRLLSVWELSERLDKERLKWLIVERIATNFEQ